MLKMPKPSLQSKSLQQQQHQQLSAPGEAASILKDEEKARQFLAQFFLKGASFQNLKNPVITEDLLLQILRKYPSLASRKYSSFTRGINAYPLVHFIYCEAKVNYIKELNDISPEAIATPFVSPSLGNIYPLTAACMCDKPNLDVITCLAELYPPALVATGGSNDDGCYLPIHAVLRCDWDLPPHDFFDEDYCFIPEDTVHLLLELSPESAAIPYARNHNAWSHRTALGIAAMNEAFDNRMVESVSEAYWKASNELVCSFKFAIDTLHNTRGVLENLCMNLSKVTLDLDTISGHSEEEISRAACFFSLMRRGTAIQQLIILMRLDGPHQPDGFSDQRAMELGNYLEDFVLHNTSVRYLEIAAPALNTNSVSIRFFDGLCRGLQSQNFLHTLKLSNFVLDNETSYFLLPRYALKKLVLEHCRNSSEWRLQRGDVSTSQMTSLAFENSILSPAFYSESLHYVIGMPKLESVEIRLFSENSLTREWRVTHAECMMGALLDLLAVGRLKHWCSTGVPLDMERLCEALRRNTNLTLFDVDQFSSRDESSILDVLENHNTTLTTLGDQLLHVSSATKEKIAFLTNFNKYGRVEARKSNLSVTNLMELLSGPTTKAKSSDPTEFCRKPLNVVSLQFGLLKECPALWSRHIPEFKRKRKRSGADY